MLLLNEIMGVKLNSKKILILSIFILISLSVYAAYCIYRPLGLIKPNVGNNYSRTIQNGNFNLKWPDSVEGAISIKDTNFNYNNGTFKPSPTASVAKLITSLVVLNKYPLSLNQQGPELTISTNDESIYKNYLAQDGSVTYVSEGEKISEYQLLESMLLPSSDNAADTLALWAFGSLKNYQTAANDFLKSNGLYDTTVGSDASGLSPDTMSTPNDLLKLGTLAVNNPVIKDIVSMKSASLPGIGVKTNYNSLLGKLGIDGIKTGNTDQAGGVLLTSSEINIEGKNLTLLSSVMKTSSLSTALSSSEDIVSKFRNNFSNNYNLSGTLDNIKYKTPWNNKFLNLEIRNLYLPKTLNSTKINISLKLKNVNQYNKSGDYLGKLSIETNIPENRYTFDVYLKDTPSKPSLWWLITHP